VLGVLFFVPVTLWRLPTFFLLFRIHNYAREHAITILLSIYCQMVIDIKWLLPRIVVFVLSPRMCFSFYSNTLLKYTNVK
jgi:hypothetical protein